MNVDLTNPGEFFACCGLFELAGRLWPESEAWFEDGQFHIASVDSIEALLERLAVTPITSSVTDEGLSRLGTLLSAKKSALSAEGLQEKEFLRRRWQQEELLLGPPFNLVLDWWRDERGQRTPLKTWAAKQFILEIVRPLLQGVVDIVSLSPFDDLFQRIVSVRGLPLYFDSHSQCQSTALDTGFSAYDLRRIIKEASTTRPALELFAFFGLQRYRPRAGRSGSTFQFSAWRSPLPVLISSIVASGVIRLPKDHIYEFRLLKRSEYMKAFLPATPSIGDLA